ncbi:MAG: hypothetical protein HQL48_08210, partial [Gammaproteobacteria bacterium]|nr:hypothetical protein [Gammaproteobacteria bacterium]
MAAPFWLGDRSLMWWRGARWLLQLLLVGILSGGWLAATETGTLWLLRQMSHWESLLGLEFSFAEGHGSLLQRLELKGVRIAFAGVRIEGGRVVLQWQPSQLLIPRVQLDLFEAEDIQLELAATTTESAGGLVLPDLTFPIPWALDRLEITRLHIVEGEQRYHLARMSAALFQQQGQIVLRQGRWVGDGIDLTAEALLESRPPFALSGGGVLQLDEAFTSAEVGGVAAQLHLGGRLTAPEFTLALTQPATLQIEGRLQLETPQPELALDATWQQLQWPLRGEAQLRSSGGKLTLDTAGEQQIHLATSINGEALTAVATLQQLQQAVQLQGLRLQTPGGEITGEIQLGTLFPYPLEGALQLQLNSRYSGDEIGQVAAALNLKGVMLQPSFQLTVSQPAPLQLEGEAWLDELLPRFEIRGRWRKLPWPLRGDPQLTATAGKLSLRGSTAAYRLDLSSTLGGESLPPTAVKLLAHGDERGIDLAPLQLRLLQGEGEIRGRIRWDELLAWDLHLGVEGIHLEEIEPQWTGDLSALVRQQGEWHPSGVRVNHQIYHLGGTVWQQPFQLSGGIDYEGEVWKMRDLTLLNGPNRLQLDGLAGRALDLRFVVDATDLAHLAPGFSGLIQGDGWIGGSEMAPQISTHLSGSGVKGFGAEIATLELDLEWHEAGGEGQLSASSLHLEEIYLDSLEVELEGEPGDHRLTLEADGRETALSLAMTGALEKMEWSGALERLHFLLPQWGEWRLQQEVELRLAQDEVAFGPLCLLQEAASLCSQGEWLQTSGIDLKGRLSRYPLTRLTTHFGNDALVGGDLGGSFQLLGQLQQPEFRFELLHGDGTVQLEEGATSLLLPFDQFSLKGAVTT